VNVIPRLPSTSRRRSLSALPSFGLLSSIIYLILVIEACLFYSWDHPILYGLRIHLLKSEAPARSRPGMQPLRVRLESHLPVVRPNLYVDSQLVPWENFETVLQKQLNRRPPNWPVYLEGDRNVDWLYAMNAIDKIRGLQAEVVLLTHPAE